MIQLKRLVTGVAVAAFGVILAAAGLTAMPHTAAAAPGDMTLTGTIAYDDVKLEFGYLYVYTAPASTPCLRVAMGKLNHSFSFTIPASTSKSGCGVEGREISLQYESYFGFKTTTSTSPKIIFTSGTTAKVNVMVRSAETPDPYPPMRIGAKVTRAGAPYTEVFIIRAYVNGTLCGLTVANPAPSVSVDVAPDQRTPGCGKDGDPITFTVDNKPATAAPPVSFKSGGLVNTTLTTAP